MNHPDFFKVTKQTETKTTFKNWEIYIVFEFNILSINIVIGSVGRDDKFLY